MNAQPAVQETGVLSPESGGSSAERHGNPPQDSCLGNPMDRGAIKTSEEAFNPVSVANHSGEAKSLEVSEAGTCAVDSALHAVCPDGCALPSTS